MAEEENDNVCVGPTFVLMDKQGPQHSLDMNLRIEIVDPQTQRNHGVIWHGSPKSFGRFRAEFARLYKCPRYFAYYGTSVMQPGRVYSRQDLLLLAPAMLNELEHKQKRSTMLEYETEVQERERDGGDTVHGIVTFLLHSDTCGEWSPDQCAQVAALLRRQQSNLPKGNDPGHIGNWRKKAEQFIRGLEQCAKHNYRAVFTCHLPDLSKLAL